MMLRPIVFGLATAVVSVVADLVPVVYPKIQVFNSEASYPAGTKVSVPYQDPDTYGFVSFIKLFQAGLPSDDPPNLPILTGDFGGGSIALQTICPNATNGYNICPTPASGQFANLTFITPNLLHSYTAAEGGAPFNYFLGFQWTENQAPNYYYSKTFTFTPPVVVTSSSAASAATSSAVKVPTAAASTRAATTASSQASATADADSSTSGGLSTAAKAGIGAGIGVAAIATIVGLFFILRRRKSRSDDSPSGKVYSQAHASNSRDLRADKEMNVTS